MIRLIDVDTVRLLLRLDKDDISDKELKQYIKHFTLVTLNRLGPKAAEDQTITDNATFQEAIMAAIACRLSLTDLDIIHSPSDYKVGDTEESYKNTSFGNYGQIPSWCDQYESLLSTLSGQYAQMTDIYVFRRHGMSVRRKWCRDLY